MYIKETNNYIYVKTQFCHQLLKEGVYLQYIFSLPSL